MRSTDCPSVRKCPAQYALGYLVKRDFVNHAHSLLHFIVTRTCPQPCSSCHLRTGTRRLFKQCARARLFFSSLHQPTLYAGTSRCLIFFHSNWSIPVVMRRLSNAYLSWQRAVHRISGCKTLRSLKVVGSAHQFNGYPAVLQSNSQRTHEPFSSKSLNVMLECSHPKNPAVAA